MSGRSVVLNELEYSDEQIAGLASKLLNACTDYDIKISYEQVYTCVRHLLYVEQVNTYINLTRITDLSDALILHILDSLLLARYFDNSGVKYLDMGTGAGFPGIPLGIVTGAHGTLIDSVGKKINAVNAFIQTLQLNNVSAVHTRIEEYATQNRECFDIVVARALAGMPILIEYSAPFLSKNGKLVISKGNPEVDELNSAQKAASICGLKLVQDDSFELPNDLGHREIYLFERVGKPSIALPRANGMARRNPLA